MTSTPFQSAALGGIIAPWAAKIAEFFGIIVEIILANAENVRTTLHELGAYCRTAPGTAAGAVLPDDGEACARLARHRAGNLLPSASALRALARPQASAEFKRAVMMNLRGKSEARSPRPQLRSPMMPQEGCSLPKSGRRWRGPVPT